MQNDPAPNDLVDSKNHVSTSNSPHIRVLKTHAERIRELGCCYLDLIKLEALVPTIWPDFAAWDLKRFRDAMRASVNIAITGEPGTGKSTLVNFLLTGRTDVQVTPIAQAATSKRVSKFVRRYKDGEDQIWLNDDKHAVDSNISSTLGLLLPGDPADLITVHLKGSELLDLGGVVWEIPSTGTNEVLSGEALAAAVACDLWIYMIPAVWRESVRNLTLLA